MTPPSRPLASSDAAASRSAAEAPGFWPGVSRTISTPGWAGGLRLSQRIPSNETSFTT